MVPLRLDACEDRARIAMLPRPQLVLKDVSDVSQESRPRRSPRRSPLRRFENVLLAAAAAAVLLYFVMSFAVSLFQTVQQSYRPSTLPTTIVISKVVRHGDTLTGLAHRYGDPNAYILDRVEQIARANNLSGNAPLVPGQRLRIPVTNPAVIAQMEHHYPRTVVAHR